MKISLLGLTFEELKSLLVIDGFSTLDAKRIFPWIHMKSVKSFDVMSDISQLTRKKLSEKFTLERPKCKIIKKSLDGTQKALLQFGDDNCAETVFIPDKKRNTICVSCQIGCAIGCKFCNTGTQGFLRNLSSSEIISQIFFWKDLLNESKITNIVFMGMGEPFLNIQNLCRVLELLLSEKAHNFSRTKITVSTSGIYPPISMGNSKNISIVNELAKFGIKLAVSLHAPNDEIRTMIMPVNKKYNISDILIESAKYLHISNTHHITFEYLLLEGINDSSDNAQQLANLLKNFCIHYINPSHKNFYNSNFKEKFIPTDICRVNLIRFNHWSGAVFKGSSEQQVNNFLKILLSNNIRAIIRKSRGDDILAACGQLKTANKAI